MEKITVKIGTKRYTMLTWKDQTEQQKQETLNKFNAIVEKLKTGGYAK